MPFGPIQEQSQIAALRQQLTSLTEHAGNSIPQIVGGAHQETEALLVACGEDAQLMRRLYLYAESLSMKPTDSFPGGDKHEAVLASINSDLVDFAMAGIGCALSVMVAPEHFAKQVPENSNILCYYGGLSVKNSIAAKESAALRDFHTRQNVIEGVDAFVRFRQSLASKGENPSQETFHLMQDYARRAALVEGITQTGFYQSKPGTKPLVERTES